jgi:type II secretory pathway component GspD/PulD (secretin)
MKMIKTITTLSLCAVIAGLVNAQSKFEGFSTSKSETGLEISFSGSKLPVPKVTSAYKGKVWFYDFPKTKFLSKPSKETVDFKGVSAVRTTWHGRPPVVRVAVYMQSPGAKPKVKKSTDGWTISFGTLVAAKSPVESWKGEPFPEKVPPIATPFANQGLKIESATPVAPFQPNLNSAMASVGVKPPKRPAEVMVSLDFSNTELVLILRALADQSGVNIVASPDISGRISVNLQDVSLTEALNLVTTIASVRYTKIGKTFLVTSTARFSDAIRQVIGKLDDAAETRVVQLRSGEGKQIKAACLKALPQMASDGYYDLILPTEKISAKTVTGSGSTSSTGSGSAGASGGSTAQGGGASGDKGASASGSASQGASATAEAQGSSVQLSSETEGTAGKDTYIVVVATAERMDEVEKFVAGLDKNIANANSLTGAAAIETRAIPLYSPTDEVVLDAVKNMASRDPRANSFKISVANAGVTGQTNASKLLVISGPANGVDDLAFVASSTDRSIAKALGIPVPAVGASADRVYEVLDLKWIEPAIAMTELTKYIRGISVSMMPSPVEPGAKGTATSSYSEKGSQGVGEQGSGAAAQGNGAGSGQGGTGAEVSKESQDSESKSSVRGTEPMKLLVFGTKAQIDEAKSLLGSLDIEPYQVAFELRVLELSKDDVTAVGLDWSIFTGAKLGTLRLNNALGTVASQGGIKLDNSHRSHGGSFEGVLDQLTNKNNLISRPNTIALDGRESMIFVGDTVRYVESIQASQSGTTVTTNKVNVGVTLNVTPRVGKDGTMTIKMSPSLSILRGFQSVIGGGQLPQTSDRKADLVFNMLDGETIAIGGLISDQDKKSFGGIPILRDLPIIGRFFSRTETTRARREIVFFVTAKIVDSKNKSTAADPRTGEKANPLDPTKEKMSGKGGS